MLALSCLTPAFTPSRQPWALPPSTRACRIRAAADDGVGGSLAVLGGSLARVADSTDAVGWQRVGPGWLRLGPATPWATVHFVGGAALGIAPQLAYDTLLSRLASSADVAVIATPYELGLDHRKLARRVASDFDVALEESRAQGLAPAEGAPVFRGGGAAPYGGAVRDAFAFVQQLGVAQGVAVEVSPTPDELAAALAGYAPAATAVFTFDGDSLDCSAELLAALPPTAGVRRFERAGSHTAPVSLRLAVSDINPQLAALLGGGSRTVSIGDAEAAEQLAEALAEWLWPAGVARPAGATMLPPAVGAAEGSSEP
ncbi:hypothetical protein EMIHUDRAFT_222892 [Emiliania huxleyi CCMP1516]|uniref:Uncharacterized protein n=2 Tax=Emiliania huxleyi TaxID=2903 RepID=A0A0D3KXC2_EMIH1|nr:hypothetical protein EMIHUDRAFT_222892 [Emiliania huxleyi CCMP1516]EOD40407.1 hypothetical protein EMIHUDRAFT_222892 [Emiliania huxleyi CCMP1516]|eukprot:XP_005792836.1 hypothetical protein EMIHUDRAFT_222892 [Emiliania huxleyi CCMP1516]